MTIVEKLGGISGQQTISEIVSGGTSFLMVNIQQTQQDDGGTLVYVSTMDKTWREIFNAINNSIPVFVKRFPFGTEDGIGQPEVLVERAMTMIDDVGYLNNRFWVHLLGDATEQWDYYNADSADLYPEKWPSN